MKRQLRREFRTAIPFFDVHLHPTVASTELVAWKQTSKI